MRALIAGWVYCLLVTFSSTTTKPADTRIMVIVHNALRRDLHRLRAELVLAPFPSGDARSRLAEHAAWLMRFLHDHHASEDRGLWPLVRRSNPAPHVFAMLRSLEADHAAIDPAIAAFAEAAGSYGAGGDDRSREELVMRLDDLCGVLLPHLTREERDGMPLVAASISDAEWRRWDHEHNIKQRSFLRLAAEGNWLLDGLDKERARIVEQLVPIVPRLVVKHVFGPVHRRATARLWRPAVLHSTAGL
jgi:hemerythrin-like domain-containing protein